MALSSKTILIICGLEIIWCCYGICISWFGIGNAYYPYFMALAPEPSWSDIAPFGIGLIVYCLSTYATLFLLYVAITGESSCKSLVLLPPRLQTSIWKGIEKTGFWAQKPKNTRKSHRKLISYRCLFDVFSGSLGINFEDEGSKRSILSLGSILNRR